MADRGRDRAAIEAMRDRLAQLVALQLQSTGMAQRVVCGPADLGTVEPAMARLRPRLLLFCDPALRSGALEVS